MRHLAIFFKDDRILKNYYNHDFKNFKIYNICPKNAFMKFLKRDKSKTCARFEHLTHRLLAYPSSEPCGKLTKYN